jgi:phage shock protein A
MSMSVKKWWKYLVAKLSLSFDAHADPKVQLAQAIDDAREQHRLLSEQASVVIANQRQAQLRVDRALDEVESLNRHAQQALIMADDAARAGDTTKAAEYTDAAEVLAARLVAAESDVETSKAALLDATTAAQAAKAAVRQNARRLTEQLDERRRLLSQLEQAKMAEQMNSAMASLSSDVGADTPTLDEVRAKIEARAAKAQGVAEVAGLGTGVKMFEVEQAAANASAQARLSEIRSKLGISDTTPAAPADTAQQRRDQEPTGA